jgi:acetyl esterase/lipase
MEDVTDARDILTRPPPSPDVTLRYGSGQQQVADLWLPSFTHSGTTGGSAGLAAAAGSAVAGSALRAGSMSRAPFVLFFHGGFWRAEWDRRHTATLAAALAGAGYAVCTPEYRRTGEPGGGWPGTFDDVAAAVDLLPGLAAAAVEAVPDAAATVAGPAGVEAGGSGASLLDPGQLVLAGHSAGGHLALWAAARHLLPNGWRKRQPFNTYKGVVALAPVSDLTACHEARLDDDAAGDLIGGPPGRYPERWAQADPARLLPLGVPVRIVHGARDERVPCGMSRDYAARAGAAGDDVTLDELPGCGHFELIDPRSAAWPSVLGAFLRVAPVRAG